MGHSQDIDLAAFDPGDRLGRYVLLRIVGRGGMGTVWAAYDPELDRMVALKLIADHAIGSPRRRAELRTRLRREARTMARLRHSNVVQVFDTGTSGGQSFVAMELVEGQTLREWAREGKTARQIVDACAQAARGLAAAHAMGIVHRDVKPQNILVTGDARVLVSDFGLAVVHERTSSTVSRSGEEPLYSARSKTGSILGTPRYMAPEQASGTAADARSDQFAWCLVLCEALSGEADKDAGAPYPNLRRVPANILPVIRRGLLATPERRYPTMDALLADLQRARRRGWRRAGTLAALGVAAGAGVSALPSDNVIAAETKRSCGGDAHRYDEVFSDSVAARMGMAFAASGASHAEESFAQVAARLDEFGEQWKLARAAACDAVVATDAQVRCVDATLHQASELVRLLRDATDRDTFDHAVSAVAQLPDPARCVAQPISTELADAEVEAVLAVERRLDTVRALTWTGRYRAALVEARSAVVASESLSHAPVRAAALLLVGELRGRMDEPVLAEEALWASIAAAGVDAPDIAASAWTRLVKVVGYDAGQPHRGLALADIAEVEVRRAGNEVELRRLQHNRALVLGAAARVDD